MPRFPKKEADINALAELMIAGLRDHPAVFPNPPFPPFGPGIGLRWKTIQYHNRLNNLIAARAVAESATAAKDEALANLTEAMKTDLLYAENTAQGADDKLKLIGWAGKKVATPLVTPGQVRLLEVPKQGAGWVALDWKAPAGGGKPNAYKVQKRSGEEAVSDRQSGGWEDVATAILTETTLVDQPRGVELEYRVIAVNKAGDGPESNTVEVVL